MPGSRRVILRHVFGGLGARMCRSRPPGGGGCAMTITPSAAAAAAAVRQPTVSMSRLRRRLSATQLGILGCGHAASAGLLLLLVVTGGDAPDGGGGGGGLATLLTLLLAGAAAVLAGLVYAELAAGIAAGVAATGGGVAIAAGPAYAAAHSALGEFLAFLIGWNLLLEHVLGGATLARCIVELLDGLLHGAVKNVSRHLFPGLSEAKGGRGAVVGAGADEYRYNVTPENMAAGSGAALLCIGASVLAVVGSSAAARRISSVGSTCLAVCAITAIIAITGNAFANADLSNWAPRAMRELPVTPGVLTRAAAMMYIFSGLDTMAASAGGPTTTSPGPSALEALASAAATVATLPSATLVCSACAAVGILLSGAALSLSPLGLPGEALATLTVRMAAPIGTIVGVLTIAGVCGALLGTSASALAVIRALASDGLLCRCIRFHGGAIVATITAVLLAVLLDLHVLVELLSAGTLLAHAAAAAAVLLLRYRPPPPPPPSPPHPTPPLQLTRSGSIVLSEDSDSSGSSEDVVLSSSLGTLGARGSLRGVLRGSLRGPPIAIPGTVRTSLPRLRRGPLGRLKPGVAALAAVIGLISAAALMGAATAAGSAAGAAGPAFAIVACLALLCAHQQRVPPSSSPAPLEPLLPAAALVLDVTLLLHLCALAWLRLAGWTAAGLLVYFSYGIRHGAADCATASSGCSSGEGLGTGAGAGAGAKTGAKASERNNSGVHKQHRSSGVGAVAVTSARSSLKRAPVSSATMANSSHSAWKPSSSSSVSSADKVPFLVEEDSIE